MDKISSFELLSSEPINFYSLKIYKPTLREMCATGWEQFFKRAGILKITEEDLQVLSELNNLELPNFTSLQYLILQAVNNPLFFLELRLAFFTFIKRDIKLTKEGLVAVIEEDNSEFLFTDENFKEFQKIISYLLGDEEDNNIEINSDNVELKEKFLKNRIALKKAKMKSRMKDTNIDSDSGLKDIILGVCSYGSYNFINVWDLTLCQLLNQFKTYQKKEQFELNYKAMLAGATKTKLKYWIGK